MLGWFKRFSVAGNSELAKTEGEKNSPTEPVVIARLSGDSDLKDLTREGDSEILRDVWEVRHIETSSLDRKSLLLIERLQINEKKCREKIDSNQFLYYFNPAQFDLVRKTEDNKFVRYGNCRLALSNPTEDQANEFAEWLSRHVTKKSQRVTASELGRIVSERCKADEWPSWILHPEEFEEVKSDVLQPADYMVGQTVFNGTYRLEKELPAGGQGKTFVAKIDRDKSNNRVVLKVMNCSREEAERQAGIHSELSKNGIANIAGHRMMFEEGNPPQPVLVSQYIEGTPLIGKIEAKEDLGDIPQLLMPIAQALDEMHKENIFHFDVDPYNIIVGKKAHLIDFGVAYQQAKEGDLCPDELRRGKIDYAAPEMFDGTKGRDPLAMDVYTFAATAYHCLTGLPPRVDGNRNLDLLQNKEDKTPFELAVLDALSDNQINRPKTCMEIIKPPSANVSIGKAASSNGHRMFDKQPTAVAMPGRSLEYLMDTLNRVCVMLSGCGNQIASQKERKWLQDVALRMYELISVDVAAIDRDALKKILLEVGAHIREVGNNGSVESYFEPCKSVSADLIDIRFCLQKMFHAGQLCEVGTALYDAFTEGDCQ